MSAPTATRPRAAGSPGGPSGGASGLAAPAVRERDRGAALAPRVAGAVAVLACAAGLHQSVQGATWWAQAMVVVAVVAAAGALAERSGRLPRWAAVVVQLLAGTLITTAMFAPAQAVLGLVPGPAAWAQLGALWRAGRQVITEQGAPVDATAGLRLVTTVSAGLLAVLVDVLATRAGRPALAGLPLLGVYVTAAVFAPGGLSWGWFVLAAAGYALLLGADGARRAQRWGRRVGRASVTAPRAVPARAPRAGAPALGTPGALRGPAEGLRGSGGRGAAALAVAVVAALVLPHLVPWASGGVSFGGGGGGSGQVVDPLIDLRADLRSREDTTVLRYRTTGSDPQPLRITTDDSFDGRTWVPTTPAAADLKQLTGTMPAAPGLEKATSRSRESDTVTVGQLRQSDLPVPYPATSVEVGDGSWRYDRTTLDVVGARGTRTQPGEQYRVTYLQVEPTARQLAVGGAVPARIRATYTKLPAGLPALIAQTARQVTAGKTTAYAKAVALQDYFRSDGGFTYSTKAPAPHSASALADFLVDKRGYCVHFASAMAVMARELGIPARVAVGFLPGTEGSTGQYRVSLRDAHAWPELYFAGAGWVRFEPTPAIQTGPAPSWTTPNSATSTSTGVEGPVPGTMTTAPLPGRQPREAAPVTGPAPVAAPASPLRWVLPLAGVLALGVLALPLAASALARRRRWRTARTPASRAEAAWADLVEQLHDLGLDIPSSATPRQVGGRVTSAQPVAPPGGATGSRSPRPGNPPEPSEVAVSRLVHAVEVARYGPPAGASPTALLGARDERGTSSGRSGADGAGEPGRVMSAGALRQDVRTVVHSLGRTRPRSAAWRSRWLPPSGVAHLARLLHRR